MSVREISLALCTASGSTVDVDTGFPLVAIEHEGRLLLVDGLKRYLALRVLGIKTAWVLVRPWDKVRSKLERLRLNNPRRRTTLKEELEALRNLLEVDGLSTHAISRALQMRRAWIERREKILKRLSPEVWALSDS